MSRGYDARRKAKRRSARAARQTAEQSRVEGTRRLGTFAPILIIVGILAAVAILHFDRGTGEAEVSRSQVDREVRELLAGIPQSGPTLGSPQAPITVQMFADLECPTVKRFAEIHLPSLVRRWVRDGTVKIEYRSLKTDTADEHTFYMQEIASLAAGRQQRMWNFLLTFLREQGQEYSGYATERFVAGVAAQVPGLERGSWRGNLENPILFKQVASGMQRAAARGFRSTPSFVIEPSRGAARLAGVVEVRSLEEQVRASFESTIETLRGETSIDVPVIDVA